jgi:hypothetical protein
MRARLCESANPAIYEAAGQSTRQVVVVVARSRTARAIDRDRPADATPCPSVLRRKGGMRFVGGEARRRVWERWLAN